MNHYIRFREQPIKFMDMPGRNVADVVPLNMATQFTTMDDALDRAHKQWGDNGLEHVQVCQVGAPHKTDRKDLTAANAEQTDLL